MRALFMRNRDADRLSRIRSPARCGGPLACVYLTAYRRDGLLLDEPHSNLYCAGAA